MMHDSVDDGRRLEHFVRPEQHRGVVMWLFSCTKNFFLGSKLSHNPLTFCTFVFIHGIIQFIDYFHYTV